ncbi:MAG TPA: hypothetical protein VFJ02_09565 [Vicinamibacterales bacterium]|nr:hypothetical protein [Vicinamibacterales bacterium]
MIHIAAVAVLLALPSIVAPGTGAALQAPASCPDSQTCRRLALEAAERKDYDAFHDLAWRALSAGPKNDPALMTLLARAQSLSGRPHDALVMLQRLAGMGVATDAATSDDFANVRALPGWADLEATLSGKPVTPAATDAPIAPAASAKSKAAAAAAAKTAAGKEPPARDPTVKEPPVADPAKEPPPAKDPAVPSAKPEAAAPAGKPEASAKPGRGAKPEPPGKTAAPEPLTFSASGVDAVGLAYDAVSGRFIVGDSRDRRLLVVGERSGRLASLAGVDAGFDDVAAFEIDTHEGDLWVVSSAERTRSATVHKLQLISGRVLASVKLPDAEGPATFADIAVTPQNILVLDSEGRRVLRLAKKGKTLDVAARLAVAGVTTLAPAAEGVAYAAFDRGILKIDLGTRTMSVVEPAERVDLAGLGWMRWYRGSLVAVQRTADGASRLLRIRLDEAGRSAKSAEVLDDNVLLAGRTSATISGNVLYYLSRASGEGDVAVRRITLK